MRLAFTTVIELSKDVRQRRITEFRKAGKHIHGATKNNLIPLLLIIKLSLI